MDLGDPAEEAWLFGVQRKLYQWRGSHPEDRSHDVWS